MALFDPNAEDCEKEEANDDAPLVAAGADTTSTTTNPPVAAAATSNQQCVFDETTNPVMVQVEAFGSTAHVASVPPAAKQEIPASQQKIKSASTHVGYRRKPHGSFAHHVPPPPPPPVVAAAHHLSGSTNGATAVDVHAVASTRATAAGSREPGRHPSLQDLYAHKRLFRRRLDSSRENFGR